VRRNRARTVAAAAAVLLVGVALVGCGRQGPTSPPTLALPSVAPTAIDTGASLSDTGSASPTDAVFESPSASSSPAVPAGQPTPDAVASELDQINQLINDIDNSVSSSDSSQQGGE
jgi:hypothetical protein